jgi:hypothetical protein
MSIATGKAAWHPTSHTALAPAPTKARPRAQARTEQRAAILQSFWLIAFTATKLLVAFIAIHLLLVVMAIVLLLLLLVLLTVILCHAFPVVRP